MLRTAEDVAAGGWTGPVRAPGGPLAVALAPAAAASAVDRVLAIADRYRWVLFGAVAAVYALAFNGQWRVQPDAALYLAIGRNLAEGHGYTFLGQTNHLAYPGWPVAIAACFRLCHTTSLVPVHLMLLAMAGGTLAATFRLVLLHADRPTAVVVTFGVAVTKSFFVYAVELWSDMPFAMAAMAMLAGYEGAIANRPGRRGRWYDWALLLGGLSVALVTRPTGWPLLLALCVAVAIDAARGRVRWAALLAGGATAVALAAAWVALDPRRHPGELFGGTYEQYLLNRMSGAVGPLDRPLAERVHALFTTAASDVLFQVRFGDVANSCLSGIVLAVGFGLAVARPLWGLWFALLLAAVLVGQDALDRYFLPVLPLLVYGWWASLAWIDRRPVRAGWPRRALDAAVLLVLGFGAIANVCKVGGIVAQQRRTPFLASYDRGHYQAVPALSDAIHRDVGEGGLVLVKPPYGRVTAYLSGRTVVNAADVRALPAAFPLAGRPVFVVEPADPSIRSLLDDAGLAEGPTVYAGPPPPAGAAKGEQLSLHATVPRTGR